MLDQPGLGEIGDPTERPEGCADGGPTAPLLGSWLVTQGDPAEERCPRLAVTVLCCSCLLFHHCPSICPLPTPFPATPTPTFSLPHSLLPIFVSPSCSLFKGKKKNQSTERLDLQMSGQETGNKGNQSRRGSRYNYCN